MRVFGIGKLQIEPQTALGEDVQVPYVTWYEDLANYIDKILYTFKKPSGRRADHEAVYSESKREERLSIVYLLSNLED